MDLSIVVSSSLWLEHGFMVEGGEFDTMYYESWSFIHLAGDPLTTISVLFKSIFPMAENPGVLVRRFQVSRSTAQDLSLILDNWNSLQRSKRKLGVKNGTPF